MSAKRPPTFGDRNESRTRVLAQPRGVGLTEPPQLAAPHEVEPEDTNQIEDPARRRQVRSERDYDERFEHVENHIDELRDGFGKLDDKVDRIAESHAMTAGKIDIFIATVTKDRDDLRDENKERRKWWRGLIASALGGGGIVGIIVAAALGHC
jgi:hypothetical protein